MRDPGTPPRPLRRYARKSRMPIGEVIVLPIKDQPQVAVSSLTPASGRNLSPLTSEATAAEHRPEESPDFADEIDRSLHAGIARLTAGLSPASLAAAYFDWAAHLAAAPGKRLKLAEQAVQKALRLADYSCRCALSPGSADACVDPAPQDRRFVEASWRGFPFNVIHQGFCSTSNGGMRPPQEFAASRSITKTSSISPRDSSSTCSRLRIFR